MPTNGVRAPSSGAPAGATVGPFTLLGSNILGLEIQFIGPLSTSLFIPAAAASVLRPKRSGRIDIENAPSSRDAWRTATGVRTSARPACHTAQVDCGRIRSSALLLLGGFLFSSLGALLAKNSSVRLSRRPPLRHGSFVLRTTSRLGSGVVPSSLRHAMRRNRPRNARLP